MSAIIQNTESSTNVSKPTLKLFIVTIRKPIYVSTLLSIIFTFLPISVVVALQTPSWVFALINILTTAACSIWAGKISYRNFKPAVVNASLAGPVLWFVAYFLVELASKIQYISEPWEPPAELVGTIFGNQLFIIVAAIFGSYLMFFPIAMGLAALGAVIEKKKTENKGLLTSQSTRTENTSVQN